MIDHPLFSLKTVANLEGIYIHVFRRSNCCLSLAMKHNLRIFGEQNEVLKCINTHRNNGKLGSDLFSMQ